MKCPIDDTELAMSERHGIEIDYCPKCRGVWLDRGELDKIIEQSASDQSPSRSREQAQYRDDPKYRDDDDRKYGSQPPHKRRSLLSDLFDF